MPRGPRRDAPGTLHHVMARGIDRLKLFRAKKDYDDFLDRLESVVETDTLRVCAWALILNHAHLLVRSGPQPLSTAKRRLMTGYAVSDTLYVAAQTIAGNCPFCRNERAWTPPHEPREARNRFERRRRASPAVLDRLIGGHGESVELRIDPGIPGKVMGRSLENPDRTGVRWRTGKWNGRCGSRAGEPTGAIRVRPIRIVPPCRAQDTLSWLLTSASLSSPSPGRR